RAAMADHAVRSVRAHVEERAGLEIACLPSAHDPPFVEILVRAGSHRWPRRHGASALELHPDGFDRAVVMQAQALTPLAVDDEEERALLAPGAEAAVAESRHEPLHPRQHLVRLGHVDGGAGGEGPLDLLPRRLALVALLGGDLD